MSQYTERRLPAAVDETALRSAAQTSGYTMRVEDGVIELVTHARDTLRTYTAPASQEGCRMALQFLATARAYRALERLAAQHAYTLTPAQLSFHARPQGMPAREFWLDEDGIAEAAAWIMKEAARVV